MLPPSYRSRLENEPSAKESRRESVFYWAAVLGALGALATIVLAAIAMAGQFGGDSHAKPGRTAGALAITQAYVRNTAEEAYADASGSQVQTLASSPAIEMLLFNGSARHALIEGARVTIESYAHIELCFTQGGGPVPEPHPYVIRLPVLPLSSEDLIESHLHDEIAPESADRIALRFGTPLLGSGEYGLYQMRVQLQEYGSSKLLDAGQFVLSLPAGIPSYDGYLPEDNAYFKQFISGDFKLARVQVTWCLRHNLASLLTILASPGKRSPELALLDHPVLASRWSQMQHYAPPRTAALELLNQKRAELAVFAASETGDRAFSERVRTRAVKQLLGEAEKQLTATEPSLSGERDIRVALHMEPSSRGQEMLVEFQRRLASGRSGGVVQAR
jgi:hypothetical protein